MVRIRKRVTRKDIRRPDRFVVFTGKALKFFEEKRAKCLASLAFLILIFLIPWSLNLYMGRQKRLASQEYSRALTQYHNGKFRESIETLNKVKDYNSTLYSHLATLYQANSYFDLKEPEKTIQLIKELLDQNPNDPLVLQHAFMTQGYSQENVGKCKDAISSFTLAEKIEGPFKEEALSSRARCSAQVGEYKKALDAYRQYLSDYPDSQRNGSILLRIQEIEAQISDFGTAK